MISGANSTAPMVRSAAHHTAPAVQQCGPGARLVELARDLPGREEREGWVASGGDAAGSRRVPPSARRARQRSSKEPASSVHVASATYSESHATCVSCYPRFKCSILQVSHTSPAVSLGCARHHEKEHVPETLELAHVGKARSRERSTAAGATQPERRTVAALPQAPDPFELRVSNHTSKIHVIMC